MLSQSIIARLLLVPEAADSLGITTVTTSRRDIVDHSVPECGFEGLK